MKKLKVQNHRKISFIKLECLKESRESNYWLRVLDAILKDEFKNSDFKSLLKESFDFKKIFTSIKLTAQQNLNKQN